MKMLYICIRARLDVKLGVAFLCTRVSKSTEQDWAKLRRVLQYVKGTIDMPRILGADDMTRLLTWVDASYAVHPDMRSHTGGCMSFGTGVLMPKSMKQKLNTKSSTEAETVGGSDYVSNVTWTELFLEHQGITLESNRFMQDNLRTKMLIINGSHISLSINV